MPSSEMDGNIGNVLQIIKGGHRGHAAFTPTALNHGSHSITAILTAGLLHYFVATLMYA